MKARRRPAYTLVELMLVMAVLVIAGSMLIPSLRGLHPTFKVTAAVDAVRAAWAHARARAIEEGRPYRFAVVPGTGHYRIAPDQPEHWGGGGAGSGSAGASPSQSAFVLADTLPKGVSFEVGGGSGGGGAAEGGGQSAASVSPSSYSHPIVFLPDGTARED